MFSEKASAIIARMRQKCVKNAPDMRQNGSCFIGKRGPSENASEIRQNCVKNASKIRGTPLGRTPFGRYRNIHSPRGSAGVATLSFPQSEHQVTTFLAIVNFIVKNVVKNW